MRDAWGPASAKTHFPVNEGGNIDSRGPEEKSASLAANIASAALGDLAKSARWSQDERYSGEAPRE